MTITVSIGQFRQDIASYLLKAQMGHKIELRDEKKGLVVAEVLGKKEFDLDSFKRTLKRTAGTFTAKNHPEWRTKKDVIRWLEKSRAREERTF